MKNVVDKTILVIEDEESLLKAIKIKMEKNGFKVITAKAAEEALDYLEKEGSDKIDVIWLDHYLLGKKDGLEFLSKIKNKPAFKKIPAFVVSNTASSSKVRAYLELGVDKYYTKSDHRLDQIIEDIKIRLKEKENRKN
jgi:DNA-binding response OmpR family regulator